MASTREETQGVFSLSEEMTATLHELTNRTSGAATQDPWTARFIGAFADLAATPSIVGPALWVAAGPRAATIETTSEIRPQDILKAFDEEPFEAGVAHSFEARLERALRASGAGLARSVSAAIAIRPDLLPDILRCVGRLPVHLAFDPFRSLMVEGLASPSLRVRDAAVRALETWGGDDARAILRAHHESVPWLRDYIGRVLG